MSKETVLKELLKYLLKAAIDYSTASPMHKTSSDAYEWLHRILEIFGWLDIDATELIEKLRVAYGIDKLDREALKELLDTLQEDLWASYESIFTELYNGLKEGRYNEDHPMVLKEDTNYFVFVFKPRSDGPVIGTDAVELLPDQLRDMVATLETATDADLWSGKYFGDTPRILAYAVIINNQLDSYYITHNSTYSRSNLRKLLDTKIDSILSKTV